MKTIKFMSVFFILIMSNTQNVWAMRPSLRWGWDNVPVNVDAIAPGKGIVTLKMDCEQDETINIGKIKDVLQRAFPAAAGVKRAMYYQGRIWGDQETIQVPSSLIHCPQIINTTPLIEAACRSLDNAIAAQKQAYRDQQSAQNFLESLIKHQKEQVNK